MLVIDDDRADPGRRPLLVAGRTGRRPLGDLARDDRLVRAVSNDMFAADLEVEIVDLGTGVTAARIETRPGTDDPVVTASVTGEVDPDVLRAGLLAWLPAHLVPDEPVVGQALPVR